MSTSLFGQVSQPSSMCLFSSTSSDPLALWSTQVDRDLPDDAGVLLLHDATAEVAATDLSGSVSDTFQLRCERQPRGALAETVLHIQSPAIRNTFIRSPPLTHPTMQEELGIRLPIVTIQHCAIGSRPFLFEIGVRDSRGSRGRIRVSNFQTEPRLHPATKTAGATAVVDGNTAVTDKSADRRKAGSFNTQSHPAMKVDDEGPLLHLPLQSAATPDQEASALTSWQTVSLPLDRLCAHLSNSSLIRKTEHDARRLDGQRGTRPTAATATATANRFEAFHCITHVTVHANVRLRRIWCSQHLPDHTLPELQLFSE
ncbi:hypothetical protein BCV70DRAFT_201925 [Testicularia cyperi]|uniref:CFA20 domain-containing protein n=1 Tax=Testicularia cyperi TaxID=1882483 RepID=A0A317XJW5_9BASI|nr:hypothetical protein BCV70DRAFT_201925 [Testicularia cyperi]